MKKPRNILEVMDKLEELEPELKDPFKSIRESVPYTAPEVMPTRWTQIANVLTIIIPPSHPKFTEVLELFNDKPSSHLS
ncbi:MAG: hypothetical protein WC375_12925 [Methanomassiliicoccales archaeon]|jgi:hypothetical protein